VWASRATCASCALAAATPYRRFQVSGFGFRVSGFRSQVAGLEFRVSGFGYGDHGARRDSGLGLRAEGLWGSEGVSGSGFLLRGHARAPCVPRKTAILDTPRWEGC